MMTVAAPHTLAATSPLTPSLDAIARTYAAEYGHLVTIANRILHDRDGAEDIVHDVMLAVLTRIELNARNLPGYLRTAVHNRATNEARRRRTALKRFVHLRFDDGQKDWDHSAAIEVGEIVAVALAAIEHLPRRIKQVATLRWFHHQTRAEIATKMGTSTKTVEKQLAAARRALRKEVRIEPILP